MIMDSSQFRHTKVESGAMEDLLSDTSLHHQELEFSLNCTKLKDTTNCFQNHTCQQLQTEGLKVPPLKLCSLFRCQSIGTQQAPLGLPAPTVILGKQVLLSLTVTLVFPL